MRVPQWLSTIKGQEDLRWSVTVVQNNTMQYAFIRYCPHSEVHT